MLALILATNVKINRTIPKHSMNTELPRNTIYITVQKFAGGKIFCSTLYISAMPSFVKIIVNKTPVNASTVPAFESQLSNHLFYRVRLSPLLFVPLCPMYLLLLFLPLWKSFHNPFIKFIYCSHIITSSPIIIDRCLLLTTERCVIITSSVGSFRSQYITIWAIRTVFSWLYTY